MTRRGGKSEVAGVLSESPIKSAWSLIKSVGNIHTACRLQQSARKRRERLALAHDEAHAVLPLSKQPEECMRDDARPSPRADMGDERQDRVGFDGDLG